MISTINSYDGTAEFRKTQKGISLMGKSPI